MPISRSDLPSVVDLIYPTVQAVAALGGSGQKKEITERVIDDIGATEEQLSVTYDNRPKSVLLDRLAWARSWAKLVGALETPQQDLHVLTSRGREILSLSESEANERIRQFVRDYRATKKQNQQFVAESEAPAEDEVGEDTSWQDCLLDRLHRLSPDGFEEFVLYLLRTFGLQLTRVGGSGDEGIDGIGTAPLSPVLSSRVAVQAKRYDPTSTVGREVVALFQRDASAAGAERAVLVTLGRFSEPARKAATAATPTVDLIDGETLCDLVRQQEIGIRIVPQVMDSWFDRFDS